MKRTVFALTFVMGLVVGIAASRWLPERAVEAQSNWQCRSWNLDAGADVTATGTWLSGARTVEITAAGLSAASRYTLVACKL
jgi:hypothetical protein